MDKLDVFESLGQIDEFLIQYGVDSGKYEVHFEDKELEPCTVGLGNIVSIFRAMNLS